MSATRLLSQLAVGSEECGAPCRGGRREGGERGHVELITYLQLLVGHGGQSRHIVGEVVGGAHIHLGVCCLVVGPHGQTLKRQRGDVRRGHPTEEHVNQAGVKSHRGHDGRDCVLTGDDRLLHVQSVI